MPSLKIQTKKNHYSLQAEWIPIRSGACKQPSKNNDMNRMYCGPEKKEGSCLPLSFHLELFCNTKRDIARFCFLVTVKAGRKGAPSEKVANSVFVYSTHLPDILYNRNRSVLYKADSTAPFADESKPLNSLCMCHQCCKSDLTASCLPQTGQHCCTQDLEWFSLSGHWWELSWFHTGGSRKSVFFP